VGRERRETDTPGICGMRTKGATGVRLGTVYGSTAAGSEREERDLGAKFWRRDGSRKCKDAVAGGAREVG